MFPKHVNHDENLAGLYIFFERLQTRTWKRGTCHSGKQATEACTHQTNQQYATPADYDPSGWKREREKAAEQPGNAAQGNAPLESREKIIVLRAAVRKIRKRKIRLRNGVNMFLFEARIFQVPYHPFSVCEIRRKKTQAFHDANRGWPQ